MGRRPDRRLQNHLAGERIAELAVMAATAARAGRLDRAARYAKLAKELAQRHQLPTPRALSRAVCKGCGAYLLPGASARVRLRPGRVVWTCLACGVARRVGRARG